MEMITAHKITHRIFIRRDPSPPPVKNNPKNREPTMSAVRNLHTDYSDTQMSSLAPSIDSYRRSHYFHQFQHICYALPLSNHFSIAYTFEATPLFPKVGPFPFGLSRSYRLPCHESPVSVNKSKRGAWCRLSLRFGVSANRDFLPKGLQERSWRSHFANESPGAR